MLRSFSVPVTDPPTILKVFRDEIARQLISEAQRLFPNTIKFHFRSPVQAVDIDKQTVTVSGDSSQQVSTCSEPVLSHCRHTHVCLTCTLLIAAFIPSLEADTHPAYQGTL